MGISKSASGPLVSLGYMHNRVKHMSSLEVLVGRCLRSHSSLGLCCFLEIAAEKRLNLQAQRKDASVVALTAKSTYEYFVFLLGSYFLPEKGELSWILDVPLSRNIAELRERLVSPCAQHGAVQQSGSCGQCAPGVSQFVIPCFATGVFWSRCRSAPAQPHHLLRDVVSPS